MGRASRGAPDRHAGCRIERLNRGQSRQVLARGKGGVRRLPSRAGDCQSGAYRDRRRTVVKTFIYGRKRDGGDAAGGFRVW